MPSAYNLPFQEAIDYFRKKKDVPTETYNDTLTQNMDKSFAVSGVMQADMLSDFRKSVDKAIAKGTTINDFREDFDRIVEQSGWDYKGSRDWRSWIIYDTNLRQSYAAGREKQLSDPKLREKRPYGLYVHGDSKVPRPEHLAWHNKVVPLDDPWWDTHTPPNGFGCTCRKLTLSKRDLERRNLKVSTSKDLQGEADDGFDYRPGTELINIQKVAAQKAQRARNTIGAVLGAIAAGVLIQRNTMQRIRQRIMAGVLSFQKSPMSGQAINRIEKLMLAQELSALFSGAGTAEAFSSVGYEVPKSIPKPVDETIETLENITEQSVVSKEDVLQEVIEQVVEQELKLLKQGRQGVDDLIISTAQLTRTSSQELTRLIASEGNAVRLLIEQASERSLAKASQEAEMLAGVARRDIERLIQSKLGVKTVTEAKSLIERIALTPDELGALQWFTSPAGHNLIRTKEWQNLLLSDKPYETELWKQVNDLERALEKLPRLKGTSWHGLAIDNAQQEAKLLKILQTQGMVLTADGFLSSTLVRSTALLGYTGAHSGILFVIRGSGRFLGRLSSRPGQKELIFQPFSKFKVTRVARTKNKQGRNHYTVTLEEFTDYNVVDEAGVKMLTDSSEYEESSEEGDELVDDDELLDRFADDADWFWLMFTEGKYDENQ